MNKGVFFSLVGSFLPENMFSSKLQKCLKEGAIVYVNIVINFSISAICAKIYLFGIKKIDQILIEI